MADDRTNHEVIIGELREENAELHTLNAKAIEQAENFRQHIKQLREQLAEARGNQKLSESLDSIIHDGMLDMVENLEAELKEAQGLVEAKGKHLQKAHEAISKIAGYAPLPLDVRIHKQLGLRITELEKEKQHE